MSKNLSLNKGAVVMVITLLVAHILFYEDGQAFAVVLAMLVTGVFLKTEGENFWFAWGMAGAFGVIFGILPWLSSDGKIDFFTSVLLVIGWVYVFAAPMSNAILSNKIAKTDDNHKEEEKPAVA